MAGSHLHILFFGSLTVITVALSPAYIDPIIVKEWDMVSSHWCSPPDLEEKMIDSVYQCFLMNSGSRDFTIQIQCENQIFPLNMTKNDVRLRICQNDPESASQLTSCYQSLGMRMDDEVVNRWSAPRIQHQIRKLISLTVSFSLFHWNPFPTLICMNCPASIPRVA